MSAGLALNVLDTAVIGGGITGLSCAYRLKQLADQHNTALDVKVFEASERFGGIIRTMRHEDCLLEAGPDAFLSSKPAALSLIKELGLEKSVIPTNQKFRRSFVASGNRLKAVPEGFYMVAPSRMKPFLISDILSLTGKIRALSEVFISRSDNEDESVESFITRRFGRETYLKIGQAMVGGIYTGDPSRLSIRHAVPRLKLLEKQYGSVIRGLLHEKKKQSADSKDAGPRYSLFVSLRDGMSELVAGLCDQLGSYALEPDSKITGVRYSDSMQVWELRFQNRPTVYAKTVYLSLPAYLAKTLLPDEMKDAAETLDHFEYESVALGHYIFDRSQIKDQLNGFGFVVPADQNRTTIAASYSSVKFEGRAPENKAVIRAFAGGAFGRHSVQLSKDELNRLVLSELRQWLGIQGEPLYIDWQYYRDAMPQYTIGHHQRVKRLQAVCESMPGIYLGGASYEGVGIPDCIAASNQAAIRLINYLRDQT